jgi:hypothetical protein
MIVPFVPTFEGNFAASHVDYRRVLFRGGTNCTQLTQLSPRKLQMIQQF